MAITLTSAFLAELRKNVNQPAVILEVALDSDTVKWGTHAPFTDVAPIVKSVSSLQNKLDAKAGYSTRGQLSVVITGRENFKGLIGNNYLKNRRVTRKDGFIAPGFAYSDYAATFTGRISDWSRKGDDLTLVISDDLIDAAKKLPEENSTKTQALDFTGGGAGKSPADIMKELLTTAWPGGLGISGSLVDTAKFDTERDNWLQGWKFSRVLTEPKEANEYLNELQQETNSFIVHDGEKISFKVFAPPLPGQAIEEWTDNFNILHGTFKQESGYKDGFYNRVVVYYDNDESGDKEESFESAVIAVDASSQSSGQWNEVKSKVVKSKWMRSFTHTQPVSITGVKVYHASRNNGAGGGALNFYYNAANGSYLTWTPPGAVVGEAVKVTKDGKFQVFGADKTKYVRVVVTVASLPSGNASDTITLTALNSESMASALAQKLLSRYRDPAAHVSFEVDINNSAYNAAFVKPTDLKDVTTDEACEKGETGWVKERVMLTSVRPDMQKGVVQVEGIETKMYRQYGFIAPNGYPDYGSATAAQRERGFIRASAPQCHVW